ncbi:LysE family translocator [Oceaniglobus ichthyenteri]|uniref:LysE family translocator n=1 Tax=Oceaniglobus ichthyenteri TaxID=2136177 RepID=UPI000D349640|nr:LysE family translocator [Oceaniglobus ichthyenteri]
MSYDLLPALVAFSLVSSITPGPNNLMLMASGANFGLRRSVPHMLGIAVGFVVMVFLVGIGLQRVFVAWPLAHTVLQVVSVAYLLYLAWKIANAAPPENAESHGTPFTFLQAAAFQWVNPKAWAMALTATSVYAPNQTFFAIALVAAVFGAVNLPSISFWLLLGRELRRILTNPARLRAFNWAMAGLLIASLWPVVAP